MKKKSLKKKKSKKSKYVEPIAKISLFTAGCGYPIKVFDATKDSIIINNGVLWAIDNTTKKEFRWNGTFFIEYV